MTLFARTPFIRIATIRRLHSSPITLRPQPLALPPRCPSCSSPLPTPLPACPTCGHISGVPGFMSFYEIFRLPYEPNPFVVDVSTLRRRFREAQAVCHPDSWTAKGANKKDIAQALSTLINEAYQDLSNPLSRVEYILKRNGFEMSETEQLDDVEFMSEIMEAREELENASDAGSITKLAKDNDQKVQKALEGIEELVGRKEWKCVKAAAVRLKYLLGVNKMANDMLQKM